MFIWSSTPLFKDNNAYAHFISRCFSALNVYSLPYHTRIGLAHFNWVPCAWMHAWSQRLVKLKKIRGKIGSGVLDPKEPITNWFSVPFLLFFFTSVFAHFSLHSIQPSQSWKKYERTNGQSISLPSRLHFTGDFTLHKTQSWKSLPSPPVPVPYHAMPYHTYPPHSKTSTWLPNSALIFWHIPFLRVPREIGRSCNCRWLQYSEKNVRSWRLVVFLFPPKKIQRRKRSNLQYY